MKSFILMLLILLFATVGYSCDYRYYPDADNFATDDDIDSTREDMTRESAIANALASLELDPTRDGFSMAVSVGIANFADGKDEFGEAVGIMYGRDNKAINVKYGRSGSYSGAGLGLTVGF